MANHKHFCSHPSILACINHARDESYYRSFRFVLDRLALLVLVSVAQILQYSKICKIVAVCVGLVVISAADVRLYIVTGVMLALGTVVVLFSTVCLAAMHDGSKETIFTRACVLAVTFPKTASRKLDVSKREVKKQADAYLKHAYEFQTAKAEFLVNIKPYVSNVVGVDTSYCTLLQQLDLVSPSKRFGVLYGWFDNDEQHLDQVVDLLQKLCDLDVFHAKDSQLQNNLTPMYEVTKSLVIPEPQS